MVINKAVNSTTNSLLAYPRESWQTANPAQIPKHEQSTGLTQYIS